MGYGFKRQKTTYNETDKSFLRLSLLSSFTRFHQVSVTNGIRGSKEITFEKLFEIKKFISTFRLVGVLTLFCGKNSLLIVSHGILSNLSDKLNAELKNKVKKLPKNKKLIFSLKLLDALRPFCRNNPFITVIYEISSKWQT